MATAELPPPNRLLPQFGAAYSVFHILDTSGSIPWQNLFRVPCERMDVDLVIADRLGSAGLKRLNSFRSLKPGWDFGAGAAMSDVALFHAADFLKKATFPAGVKPPSLFMNKEGNLELGWESSDDKRIYVEFSADAISVYRESSDTEVDFSSENIAQAVEAACS